MIDEPITREYVIARLEEAGSTLLAMHLGRVGPSERVTAAWPEMLRDSFIDLPDPHRKIRMVPGADKITRMDEALGWIELVPNATYRRVLCARCLVLPQSGRHLRSWSSIARTLHADREAVQWWHDKAICQLVSALSGSACPAIAHPRTSRRNRYKIRAIYAAEAA